MRNKTNKERKMNIDFSNMEQFVTNAITSRSQLIKQLSDPKRDIDAECRYPDTDELTLEVDYYPMYYREPIAARVVEVLPEESWQVSPSIVEESSSDSETEFEKTWKELGKQINETFHNNEEGHPIWNTLLTVDILSGIGHYGVILLGLDDGLDWNQPVEAKENKLIFLRAFGEKHAKISSLDKDPKSKRYGQPEYYEITFQERLSTVSESITKKVHWSRVVHIAENTGESLFIGTPRQRPVFNRLLDLKKLYGGSAEMYWKGAFPGLAFETQPQLAGQLGLSGQGTKLKDQVEDYYEGLQRYLAVVGFNVKSLSPQVASPKEQIETQIDAICVKLAIPKRIFMGSERGQLASGQDDKTWNDRLMHRQRYYLTPNVICRLVDRLIQVRVLPEPKQGYSVVWPDLNTLSSEEKANVASTVTESLVKYVQGGVDVLIPPIEYLTKIIGMTQEDAEAIIEAASEQVMIELEQQGTDNIQGEPSYGAVQEA